jgi:hypothetical protein
MASEQVPSPAPEQMQQWFARLGLSGKLLAIGGLGGIIVAFLPLVSTSVAMPGPGGANPFGMPGNMGGANQLVMSINKTVAIVEDWRGKICLAAYLAAVVFAFVLYPPNGLRDKALCWGGVGGGLVAVVLAIWLLVLALDTGSADLMGMGIVKASVGIGAFLNVLAGAAVAIGGFLKAQEEKLI